MSDGEGPLDEEGKVDQKVKSRILNSRERIDEAEREIFVDVATDPHVSMSDAESTATWGVVVKQYLRNVEPILRSEEVANSQEFYKNIKLGTVRLVPPEKGGRDYSIVDNDELSEREIREHLRLPFDATIPQPEEIPVKGLETVIEMPPVVSHTWRVRVGTGVSQDYQTLQAHSGVPKQIYRDAVRKTDEFLQDAGIGIKYGHEEKSDRDENPF